MVLAANFRRGRMYSCDCDHSRKIFMYREGYLLSKIIVVLAAIFRRGRMLSCDCDHSNKGFFSKGNHLKMKIQMKKLLHKYVSM